MRDRSSDQRGFTIIELLVSLSVFAAVSVGFYQVMLASAGGSATVESGVRISEEARLGFNRLVRDVREADYIADVTATSFRIFVDFDGNGSPEASPGVSGNYENLTITFNRAARTISLTSGSTTEVLVRGVGCVVDAPGCTIFGYASSRLEYDSNGNGVTSVAELDDSPIGNNDDSALPSALEVGLIDIVSFSMEVQDGDADDNFYAQAQLRNRR